MKVVYEIISREIKNQRSRFVFPSETAAALWARKSCEFTGERSVALNRFLAWDRFKETAIRPELLGREPVSAVIRKLFAGALVQKNAQAAAKAAATAAAALRLEVMGGSGRPRSGLKRGGATSPAGGEGPGLGSAKPRDIHGREAGLETSPPFPFRSLIPLEFAEDGALFAGELAALLPSLGLLRSRGGLAEPADDEDRDFALLEGEYGAFLAEQGLFEPAWERPPLGDREHGYFIFFPAAMEDYEEYRGLLSGEPSVHVIEDGGDEGLGEAGQEPGHEPLALYDSSRTEVREAAREIRRFHEAEGIPYEDMALSVPDLGDTENYLLREFGLYDIPVRRRAGRPLAEYGAGKLFSLIGECVNNNFSFTSLKALLLDEQIPWRYPALNRDLIDFGVTNNCVSSYREGGRLVDVWSEALGRSGREEGLRNYYEALKGLLVSLGEARSFGEIRRRYFAFRGRLWERTEGGEPEVEAERLRAAYPEAAYPRSVFRGFLSRDRCSGEGDAVLARCVEELSALIRLEEKYPALVPASPFNFFLNELREKLYVPVSAEGGVNIFPYRVAAAAPFAVHLVLGASQQGATVLYQPLRFLRQDKRKRLGITDYDASAVFFRLYRMGSFETVAGVFMSHTRISAAERTFSGWAIPHSRFAGACLRLSPPGGDPFQEERAWWAAGGGPGAVFPSRLFAVQKRGFDRWYALLRGRAGTAGLGTGAAGELLRGQIDRVQRGDGEAGDGGGGGGSSDGGGGKRPLKVSATDLNGFFNCPVSWLWGKIFYLEDLALEARLLDDASLGLLYHEILKNLFTRIRSEDRIFNPERLGVYRQWAEDYTKEAAEAYPAFQGPLAVPLLVSLSRGIAKRIRSLLDTEARYFPGFTVADLEASLELRRGDLLFKGRLDRVSVSPDDEPYIMDYKTGTPPSKAASTETGDTPLRDFQIPLYVKLYEEKTGVKAGGAFFISINHQDITAVIGTPGGKRGHSREGYQPTLEALETYIGKFAAAVDSLDFSPRGVPLETCFSCRFRGVCRRVYALNKGDDNVL